MAKKVYSWRNLLLEALLLTTPSGLVLYAPFDRENDNMWFPWVTFLLSQREALSMN